VTLFDKYGGFSTVSRIVMAFYDRILDSDQVGDYFEDIDMKRLIDHQTKFVASLMGGPASFSDDMLQRVHQNLDITREDFDEVARLMRETLAEFDVEHDDIETVMFAIEDKSRVIITR
jgi:hemoglobin